MSLSVQDLQVFIANEMDQSATSPTTGGTDWTIRLNALNRANIDWSESNDWEALKKVFNGLVSTANNNASYALPADFKKLDGFVVTNGYNIGSIDPSRNLEHGSADYFVNILGNNYDGKTLYISAGTLASGASVQFTYYAMPATLATTTQQIQTPDPTYLVQRALYYLYKNKEDPKFPEAKVEADRILARMIENENSRGISDSDRRVRVGVSKYSNWRIGNNG